MDEPVGQAQTPETRLNPELQTELATAVPFMEQAEAPTAQA
jgi:hypothetical protein